MRKILIWIVVLGVLGTAGWVAFKWYRVQGIPEDAFSLIPQDAIYCIATDDPIERWKQISSSGTWSHLQKNAYFAALTASANNLDSLIHENGLLVDLIGPRALIVSAHMTAPKQHDFLFLVDLEEASGIKFLNEYLTTFSTEGFSVRTEKYGDHDLITIHNTADKSNLYLSLPGTYLLASYTKKIITNALDSHNGNDALSGTAFTATQQALAGSSIVQLYLNYAMLPAFMSCYSDGSNEYIDRLSKTLQTSSLDVRLEGELIKAAGYTKVNDSVESYLRTLAISGKGPAEFAEIAPKRTAFCLGLGFTTFAGFFQNFEKNLQEDVTEYKTYRENLKQVEDYLKIDLQKNVVDWIGDEIALLELQSSGKGLDNETALVLKAGNIEKARKDLAYIEKMVRRKTPVKFKAVDYRGYSIRYLSMKGLFKVLLGKFFARYDKPYYTIINNFVIFSNHPQTLESIVDDYLDKNTLIRSEEYRTFRKEFEDEGSVFVYLNTPVLFGTMKKLADNATRVSMEHNKEYIVCFRQVGFQLVPEEDRFKTMFVEQFISPEPPPQTTVLAMAGAEPDSSKIQDEALATEAPETVEESDPMELPYIYAQNLHARSHTDYFADSTVHFTVELKNGFKDGSFTEYYENGEEKLKGHFRSDKRDGTWYLYDESGKLVLKRIYDAGEIRREKVKD
jgi:hypothetical protein